MWEIRSLHNLEMQLQHELISRAKTPMQWGINAEQGVLIARQCHGSPRQSCCRSCSFAPAAAAGLARPGFAETNCSLLFISPSYTALGGAAGESALTERSSVTVFYINARFSPSSPQLPCWFLWTLHCNFGHTACYILWTKKTKEIMQKQTCSQFLLRESIDYFSLLFHISLK